MEMMTEEIFDIGCRCCHVVKSANIPQAIIIKPLGEFERLLLRDECQMIGELSDIPFVMLALEVTEEDLLPAEVNGTFNYLEETLMPWIMKNFDKATIVLGGYSLGGLFALWSATKLEGIDAVFAGSPSLWMEGWDEYAVTHPTKAKYVYMSLGDKEECTKKQPFCKVGDRVRQQHQSHLHQLGLDNCCLEWNEGGHFKDIEMRKAKGFAWCLNKITSCAVARLQKPLTLCPRK